MKVLPFVIPKAASQVLTLQEDKQQRFYDHLHQHPEIQLSYILDGEGTLFSGQSVWRFSKNELIAIGGNIPHVFKSDPNTTKAHRITIFIDTHWLSNNVSQIEEFKALDTFLTLCKEGFVLEDSSEQFISQVKDAFVQTGISRLKTCLSLFELLGQTQVIPFNNSSNIAPYKSKDSKRMSAVIDFTLAHYKQPITLNDAAQKAALTLTAFCKYFKRLTGKTYTQFLNEVRVESAARLLLTQHDKSVSQIAEEVGYANISHFNRQFKKIKKATPRAFRI
ncbi:MAG: AraC family transcriptional regulator [Gilvibacter sp.]